LLARTGVSDSCLPTVVFVAALAALLGPFVSRAWGCDSTVRGKAFEEGRDVHRLCVISDGQDTASQALFSRLEKWLAGPDANLNMELVRLDARDDNVQWQDYGIPSAPPQLPVVMLAGYNRADRRSFVITHWEPGPTDSDLAALKTSPVREAIKRDVVKHWAVLLYSPGTTADGDNGEGRSVLRPYSAGGGAAVVDAVAKRWSQEHPPGISVVRLDRCDPRERLLASFVGLGPSGDHGQDARATVPDWVGVVFGRGKLMAPPLEGGEITEEALGYLLSQLIEICSCLRPPSMMGVDIPMAWEPGLDEAVASLIPSGIEDAMGSAIASEKPSSGPTSRTLLAATVSAIGLAALVVFGATFLLTRRSKRQRAGSL